MSNNNNQSNSSSDDESESNTQVQFEILANPLQKTYKKKESQFMNQLPRLNHDVHHHQFFSFDARPFYSIDGFRDSIFRPSIQRDSEWFKRPVDTGKIGFSDIPDKGKFDDREYAIIWSSKKYCIKLEPNTEPLTDSEGVAYTTSRYIYDRLVDAGEYPPKAVTLDCGKQNIPDVTKFAYLLQNDLAWDPVPSPARMIKDGYIKGRQEKIMFVCPQAVERDNKQKMCLQDCTSGDISQGIDVPSHVINNIIRLSHQVFHEIFPEALPTTRPYVSTIQILRKGTTICQKTHADVSRLSDDAAEFIYDKYKQLPLSLLIPLQPFMPKPSKKPKKPKTNKRKKDSDTNSDSCNSPNLPPPPPPPPLLPKKLEHGTNIFAINKKHPTLRFELDVRPPRALGITGDGLHAGAVHLEDVSEDAPKEAPLLYNRMHISIDLEAFPRLDNEVNLDVPSVTPSSAKLRKKAPHMNCHTTGNYGGYQLAMTTRIKNLGYSYHDNNITLTQYKETLKDLEKQKKIFRKYIENQIKEKLFTQEEGPEIHDPVFWNTSLSILFKSPAERKTVKNQENNDALTTTTTTKPAPNSNKKRKTTNKQNPPKGNPKDDAKYN